MNVVLTGGAGFLGQRLARELLRAGTLHGLDGSAQPIERLTLVDLSEPSQPIRDDRLSVLTGDIADRTFLERALGAETDAVFHLAAVVSGMAEAEFDLGMRVNVDATRALLEVCRAAGRRPRVVFTSSVAVYGGPIPHVVTDTTAVVPQTSYGTQKAISELLINDYSRKGFVDGRVLRLPTVAVRPGRPNAAASSFVSGIIREPLNGEPAICPVAPDTRIWVAAPSTVVRCLIAGHDLSAEAFGASRIVNLPGLSVTPREMAVALERVAGAEVARRIEWTRDPRIERMVASWPGAWDNSRALALGFRADADFESVIRAYVEEQGLGL